MNEKYELATTELSGDVFVAVQDGDRTYIYGPDGDLMITFFANAGNIINSLTLRLIVSAYFAGQRGGEEIGADKARRQIRQAFGL